jgi:hypothetical protein
MTNNGLSINSYINQLISEACQFSIIGKVVASDESARIVLYDIDGEIKDLIRKINALVEVGGKPIGMIGIKQEGGGKIISKPIDEFYDDSDGRDHLSDYNLSLCMLNAIDSG